MAVLVLLGLFGAAGSARAASTTSIDPTELDKCLGKAPVAAQPPTCTFDANGHLIERSAPSSGGGFDLAPFFVVAVIWSAVPVLIAVSVTRSRNEPVGMAVVLTLVLGWIGLLIVLYRPRLNSRI